MTLLTQDQLAQRWKIGDMPVCDRTVRRTVRRYGLKAKKVTGVQPLYSLRDVRRMERRREADMLKTRERISAKISRANRRRKVKR